MTIKRIGTMLLEKSLISEADLAQAVRLQNEVGGLIGQALMRIGAVSEDDLLDVLSEQLDLTILKQSELPTKPDAYQLAYQRLEINSDWLKARKCVIWQDKPDGDIHVIAYHILDPQLQERLDAKAYEKGVELIPHLSSNQTLETGLYHAYPKETGDENQADEDTQRLREMAEGAPVIDFVNRVFSTALKENASDIHIEPFEHKFQVRYRIDGVLHTRQTEPRSRFDAVASRVKLLSGMDIAERRLPQDGRQTIRFSGQEIDLRVSSLPGSWGESLVLRLLRKEQELLDLESLGLEGRAKTVLQELLSHPNGVILVTGPTGSGKSTTLYRSLLGLNDGIRKIITIEDPVEYDMDGIIQIQTKANIGYTFAKGLRAILRQDPDIIMVGEIRDGETATIAAQAALTGHLVLSTLHTNSALAAVARLVDIGLEPYMVASAVRGLAAQRLVRRLCEHCKVPAHDEDGENLIWDMAKRGGLDAKDISGKAAWAAPKGCELCSHTGYLGRVAIFEVAKIDDALSEAILQRASLRKLVQTARKQGFMTLMEDGAIKARSGMTTLSEVMRVCGNDDQGFEHKEKPKPGSTTKLNLYPS
ncbi:MAG TPA: type II/IV secretion system protein [Hellea balneolensis]|uniref:Type II/IV secretion system protein n=1 Tax=Hellea balneolensis TaxID=287478 RepID=A0A7C5LZE2_9PROT|nr:type II/IV secretion system protein [Hellea balneolensis]